MKIENPIQNTSITPSVSAPSSDGGAASSSTSSTDFANVLEQARAAEPPATRLTRNGDTLIGIVREEARSKRINLTGTQGYKVAL